MIVVIVRNPELCHIGDLPFSFELLNLFQDAGAATIHDKRLPVLRDNHPRRSIVAQEFRHLLAFTDGHVPRAAFKRSE